MNRDNFSARARFFFPIRHASPFRGMAREGKSVQADTHCEYDGKTSVHDCHEPP
jgi:hypothetical protein